MFFSDVQKLIMAVSKANMQMVKRYCQNDSSKFRLAMASAENFAVYKGMRINEISLVATLLSP